MLLDVRIYRIHAGKRPAFHALVRDETVPMARVYGQRVIAFGPSSYESGIYYLVRAFRSAAERTRLARRLLRQ
jgi:NIPSNAP.